MINAKKLKGAIAEAGRTQGEVAGHLGISQNTLSRKIQKGVFSSDEISLMIEYLSIKDPLPIFFAQLVS